MERIAFSSDDTLTEEIEHRRGYIPRSTFIRKTLREALNIEDKSTISLKAFRRRKKEVVSE